ncbi:MAG: DHH family phosphoesterase [Egibacteraceae bacterium]
MSTLEQDWDRAVAVLLGAAEVALTCHVDPDGDALGSMLALERVLRLRGVRTSAAWGDAANPGENGACAAGGRGSDRVPKRYLFLPGIEHVTSLEQFPRAPDVLVVFDCASIDRVGTLRAGVEAAGCVIVVDHHGRGVPLGDIRLVDAHAAATAVLVEELVRRMGAQLDREIATCLYVGLVTDTGRFQYASTTPAVMELGGRLIACGIDHAAINRQVWDSHSFGYVKALGRAMERAQVVPEAGLAWTAVWQDDLAELGIAMDETEDLIDVLCGIDTTECTCVCKEQQGGEWKVSLRSKGRVDVGRIAVELGGGGHAVAAGFTTSGSLDDVVGAVVTRLIPGPARG